MATELETTWISRTFLSRNRSFRWKGPSLFRQVVVFAKSGALRKDRKGKRKTECPTLHIVLGMAKTMFEPLRSWCPFCTEASIILQSHGVMDLKAVSWWETVSRTWETPCISRFVVSFSGGGSRSSLWWAGIHEHSERDDWAQGVEQFDLDKSVDSFASNVSQHMFSSWCIEDPFMIKHDKSKVGSILCRESNLIQTPNIFILAAQTVPQIFVDGKIIPGWDLRCQRCQWCHALCEYWVSPDKKQKTTTSPRR